MVESVETVEAQGFPREIKYLITPDLARQIVKWARAELDPDPNGVGPYADEYQTTSVYFDTKQFDVYHARGSYGKGKYRIRRYGSDSVVFLERKYRTDRFLIKRRTPVEREDVLRLFDAVPRPNWPGYWFHRRLRVRRLEPICQVSYRRTARMAMWGHGRIRLTVDDNIRGLPMPDLAFIPDTGLPLLSGQLILELKYYKEPPPVFKELIERFSLSPTTVSKYRAGVAELGYIEAARAAANQAAGGNGGESA